MKACQYVLRVNHRQYLVLINPTKLIFCPIFEGDATRRGGWLVDSGGPTGGGDRGRWPIRGCYAIKLPPILLGHPTLTLSLVLCLRQCICICPCICVFEVCSRCTDQWEAATHLTSIQPTRHPRTLLRFSDFGLRGRNAGKEIEQVPQSIEVSICNSRSESDLHRISGFAPYTLDLRTHTMITMT